MKRPAPDSRDDDDAVATAHEIALRDFAAARKFALDAHADDVAWIEQRAADGLVRTVAEFYEEYAYVVVASGFRGRTAAALAPRLVTCRGDLDAMLRVFANHAKCRALADTWRRWGGADDADWTRDLRPRLEAAAPDAGAELLRTHLGYIGPVTKQHLARNIGVDARAVKPDVHLVRYAVVELGYASPNALADDIMRRAPDAYRPAHAGTVDFMLWLWLSHERGARRGSGDAPCCAHRLR